MSVVDPHHVRVCGHTGTSDDDRGVGDRSTPLLAFPNSNLTRSITIPSIQRPHSAAAMFDFTQGTQARGWLFKSPEELGACVRAVRVGGGVCAMGLAKTRPYPLACPSLNPVDSS